MIFIESKAFTKATLDLLSEEEIKKVMDKQLFQELTGALKDAAAFERGKKIDLRVAKMPRPPKPMAAKQIIQRAIVDVYHEGFAKF
jgi:hypothetical protein